VAPKETILDQVERLVAPVLAEMSLELVDLEFNREGRSSFLRFFIDKEGGVTLDDCADFSREVSALLDVDDVIDVAYRLEVSSPGLERPLKKAADFERFAGKPVKIKTRQKLDPDQRGHERKTFFGTLLGHADGLVSILQTDKKGGRIELPLEEIEKANLELDF
jgi:ribosome maturation factor RimP